MGYEGLEKITLIPGQLFGIGSTELKDLGPFAGLGAQMREDLHR
jgi:hypothetical protein